jgi:four helix bundle protein
MKDFRDLRVWETSHKLALDIYKVTAVFPKSELYGLTSQIRRSSSSIGANIAEGCGKCGNNEVQRLLERSLTELRKMLTALLQKIESDRLMAKC